MKTSAIISFRISEHDENEVEHWIFEKKKFKSKSDFGAAAIRHHLDHLVMMDDCIVRIYGNDDREEHSQPDPEHRS